jgi:hypothetical protein
VLGHVVARGPLQERLGEWFTAVLLLPLGALVLAAGVWSGVYLLRTRRRGLVPAAAPAGVLAGSLALVASGLPQAMVVHGMFLRYEGELRQVVALLGANALQPDAAGSVPLPATYRHLSRDRGRARVYERDGVRHVLFPATRGLFQEFSGFIFRADAAAPQPPARFLHGEVFKEVVPLHAHWTWVDTW